MANSGCLTMPAIPIKAPAAARHSETREQGAVPCNQGDPYRCTRRQQREQLEVGGLAVGGKERHCAEHEKQTSSCRTATRSPRSAETILATTMPDAAMPSTSSQRIIRRSTVPSMRSEREYNHGNSGGFRSRASM